MTEKNEHPIKSRMKTFVLERNEDASGVSGTGVVAEGVEFTDGTAVIRWLTHYTSSCFYENMKAVEAIHGHEGRTVVRWI